MKTKDAMKISIETRPNGYSLTVNGERFLYFNEVDLMAGFMAHVGLGETTSMERGTILSALMSAMLGDAYADAVTTLKQRVGLLTGQYNATIERMDKSIDYVTQAEKTISGFRARLDSIEAQIKGTELEISKNKKAYDEIKAKFDEIDKKADDVSNTLSNSSAIMKAMNEAAAKKKKDEKSSDAKEVPDKSGNADGKSAEPAADNKRKGKGGRNKAADAKIVKEIEKKAKENPNIK